MRGASVFALLCCALFGSVGAQAQDNRASVDQIVDRVQSIYQVDRLNRANTIRIEEDRRLEFRDHEYTADFHELSAQRQHHVLDFSNRRASSEYLTNISNSNWHGRNINTDGKSQFILYATGAVRDQGEQDFSAYYGSVIRSSGALLARELINARETAGYAGEKTWLGKKHDALTFEVEGWPPMTIFVDRQTGYITYMTRTVGNGIKVSYTFRRHSVQDGIPVAAEHSVYSNSDRLYFGYARRLAVNYPPDQNAFEIDAGIVPEPEQIDQSAMTVEQIGENVHHVGQDGGYSTFFSTGEGVVAYGMGAGFGERLQAFRDQTSTDLPLTHAVIADLHGEDRLGAPDAAQAGAVLLVTRDAADRVRSMLQESHPDAQIETVDSQLQLGDLTIYDLATAQAASNLVGYHAPTGVFTQTGHFYNPFPSQPGYADYTAVTLRDAVAPLAITPRYILSNESRKAETWDKFLVAVDQHRPGECFNNRPICASWLGSE